MIRKIKNSVVYCICLILLLGECSAMLYAQEYRSTGLVNYDARIELHDNIVSLLPYTSSNLPHIGTCPIHSNNGDLLFYYAGTTIYDAFGNALPNGDSIIPTTQGLFLRMSDSTYYFYHDNIPNLATSQNLSRLNPPYNWNTPISGYRTKIEKINNKWVVTKKNAVYLNSTHTYSLISGSYRKENVKRVRDYEYICTTDSFIIKLWGDSVQYTEKRSTQSKDFLITNPQVRSLQNVQFETTSRITHFSNNNGSKVFFNVGVQAFDTTKGRKWVYNYSSSFIDSTNNTTLNNLSTLYFRATQMLIIPPLPNSNNGVAYYPDPNIINTLRGSYYVSPNDSFIYSFITELDSADNSVFPPVTMYQKRGVVQQSFHSSKHQFMEYDDAFKQFYELSFNNSYLKGFFSIYDKYKRPVLVAVNKDVTQMYILRIKNDLNHWVDKLETELDSMALPNYYGVNKPQFISDASFYIHQYVLLDHDIVYNNTCGGEVTFQNISDESFGITEYEWKIALDTGHTQWFTYTGKTPPKLTYKQSGDYFYKVHGISTNGNGYAEWYTDTLKVRIPTPPTANFRTNNPICLFTPLDFDNQSNQGQVNPNTGVSYLWSFGDGATSTAPFPKHSYTKAGVYDAQLIVNNGYCADTLLKTQYIRAVDAPEPGMVLNETEACTPFNLSITEINKRPVIKRTYTMGDGQTENPTGTSFSYLYNQPGTYQIIQILESTSGCMARDTITIRLRKGFEPTDSAKMLNGTYVTNETIALQWQPLPDAAGYQLFGSATQNGAYAKIKEVGGTETATNITNFTPKVQFFGVTGLDSCGNSSAMGNISAPIFLQHTQNGNTSVALNYTAYLDWQVPINRYEIEYTYGADTQLLVSQNTASPYIDFNFAQAENTIKCYRVTAYSTDGRKTQSNIVCVGMVPVVFIPNAFTPNKDGLNEVFTPSTIGVKTYEMQIYSRWGELISKTTNTGWDAGKAQEGVYKVLFYGKSATGEQINITGNVLLLK